MICAVWRARTYGLVTSNVGRKRSRSTWAVASAWARPAGVRGTSGVRVKTRSRLPSLSPWRTSRTLPTSAIRIDPIDELAETAGAARIVAQDEPRELVELRLLLLLERPALLDAAATQEVDEVGRPALELLGRHGTAEPDDETIAHVAGRMVDAIEARHLVHGLGDARRHAEERQVVRRHEPAAEQVVVHVALPRLPVRAARRVEKDDRHGLALARLHERQRFVGLVHGAEATREEHHGIGFLHEHHLAREEVAERDQLRILGDELVRLLLEREPDVHAEAALAARALLRRAHDAAARAGDHHEALLGDVAGGLPRRAVGGGGGGRARRPRSVS